MSKRACSIKQFTSRLLQSHYVCPSCSFKRALSARANTKARDVYEPRLLSSKAAAPCLPPLTSRKYASTTSSVTAVNIPRTTPPAFRKLDQALSALGKEAAVYVNTSQLHLTLRGLESENAITRIASRFGPCVPIYGVVLTGG